MPIKKSFYEYFKENMDGLNLPAPEHLFSSVTTAVGTIQAILVQMDKYGPAVTVGELAVAGTTLEILGYLGACSAAVYAGACIGSLAVATGRSLSGGYSLSGVLATANRYNLNRPWVVPTLFRYPGLYDNTKASRRFYRYQGVMA